MRSATSRTAGTGVRRALSNRTGDGGPGGPGGGGEQSTLGGGVGGWDGDGGGIWSEGATSGSEVILTQVTIAGNGLGVGASPATPPCRVAVDAVVNAASAPGSIPEAVTAPAPRSS